MLALYKVYTKKGFYL